MSPYEIMLSESQERMLIVCKPGSQESIIKIFEKWDIEAYKIGEVVSEPNINIYYKNELVANIPISPLVDCPTYTLKPQKAQSKISKPKFNMDFQNLTEHIFDFVTSNNLSSRNTVFQRYDHQVQNNTVITPGHSSAGIRIKETGDTLLLSTDGNSRYCSFDPYLGTLITVAESCRNISTLGGTPLAITNCLNFGNPENPEIYYQLDKATTALSEASEFFNAPVISGNVSLYNETNTGSIKPTPIISTLGINKNKNKIIKSNFTNGNDIVYLLGSKDLNLDEETLLGSEYENHFYNSISGIPSLDLNKEKELHQLNINLIDQNLINSANDCSDGGLLVSLIEQCLLGDKGFRFTYEIDKSCLIPSLFGEVNSRIIVSIDKSNENSLITELKSSNVPYLKIGEVNNNPELYINDNLVLDLLFLKQKWLKKLGQISN